MESNVNVKQLAQCLIRCLESKVVPMIHGAPGIGKSDIVKTVAKAFNLKLIDIRLAQADVCDLNGLPHFVKKTYTDENGKEFIKEEAEFTPFNTFPVEGMQTPLGSNGWLIFFDELSSAPKNVQAAAYKIILDRQVGIYNLHPNCFIICAGNRKEDKAVVSTMSSALTSRMAHFTLEVDKDTWIKNFAIPHKIDPRIIAFISAYPELLDNFDPEQAEETYACPRTWEFANRLLASKKKPELDSLDKILLQSVIGLKAASDFYTFTRYYSDLPTIQEVEANPTQVPLPNEACAVWALVTSLVQQATDKNLDALIQCVTRCDISYQVVFVKMLLAAHKEYTLEPSVSKLVTKLGSKLN